MADFDIYNDKLPFRKPTALAVQGRPTISQLKAALTTYSATSYTPARLASMTKNDLLNAARLHQLTVNTTMA